MKKLFTLLLSCITLTGFTKEHKTTYEMLCQVNKCWTEQTDIGTLPTYTNQSERGWIKVHLELVEQTLRSRSTAHLTPQQKRNRLAALDNLHKYWQSGAFPINDITDFQTPIFIDKHDNFCAVGYLVKATGHEQVSRMIAAKTNLAYVREMNYPELDAWANEYGFTEDELAWIQPGYPPNTAVAPVGKGTNGEVFKLAVSTDGSKLYVGGEFDEVDGTTKANSIAYVTEWEGQYTWHSMGQGIDGTVHAIAEHDGKVFVGGDFSATGNNVAYWDGKWNYAGCISGVVNDLIVFNNELYAVGDFDVCAAMNEVNFAKWDGKNWQQIPWLEGHINTVEVDGNALMLGGKFTYKNVQHSIIKWDATNSYTPYMHGIDNEVKDIHIHEGELYASTYSDVDTTKMLYKLDAGTQMWQPHKQSILVGYDKLSLNTLCSDGKRLLVGGDVNDYPIIGISILNCAEVNDSMIHVGNSFGVDSAINSMVIFNGKVVAGGKFNKGSVDWHSIDVNSIAVQSNAVSVKDVEVVPPEFTIYPNPVNSSDITIENDFNANQLRLTNINGQLIAEKELNEAAKQIVALPVLAAGVYMIELQNDKGVSATQRLVIE